MLSRFSSRLSFVLLFSTLGTGAVIAQESLQVAGPITALDALPAGTSVPPYSFAATINFDPNASPDITNLSPGNWEESLFHSAIKFIEYSIIDNVGTQIAHVIVNGNTTNELRAVNDLSGSGNDIISYHMTQSDAGGMDDAMIRFADSNGGLVTDIDSVPAAPTLGSFTISQVFLNFIGSDSIYLGSGMVSFIGSSSSTPFEDCAEQARNHGQYVRCVTHINNLLRADGEMTGREKGQAQKEAAQKPR